MFVASGPDVLTVAHILLQKARSLTQTHKGRLGPTLDLGVAEIGLSSPRTALLGTVDPNRNEARVAARLAQLFGGYCDPELLAHHDPTIRSRIVLDGSTYDGGYGPSLALQLPRVAEHLARYPDTRRAIVWLAETPKDLNAIDVPTVFGMQFRVARSHLDAIVYSRSLDFMNSLSVDAAIFSAILDLVAFEVSVPIGALTIVAGSCHAHSHDIEGFERWRSITELPPIDASLVQLRQELDSLRRLEAAMVGSCQRGLPAPAIPARTGSGFATWVADRLSASHAAHAASSI